MLKSPGRWHWSSTRPAGPREREEGPVPVAHDPARLRSEVRPDRDDGHGRLAGQPRAPLVVDADDTPARVLGREERRLRPEVVLHRLVEVEVVLREVGEQGDVEDRAVDAVLGERVARDLHDDVGRAGLPHHGEQGVQVGRLRSGANRLDPDPPHPRLDRAEEAGRLAERAQARLDEVRGRRLAVGAGDPDQGEVAGGLPVDEGGHVAEDGPWVGDHEHGDGDVTGQLGPPRVGEQRPGRRRRPPAGRTSRRGRRSPAAPHTGRRAAPCASRGSPR